MLLSTVFNRFQLARKQRKAHIVVPVWVFNHEIINEPQEQLVSQVFLGILQRVQRIPDQKGRLGKAKGGRKEAKPKEEERK